MKRYLASVLLCVWSAMGGSACNVDETHTRCGDTNDCDFGQECYLGFCVVEEALDAASGESREAVRQPDAAARRRPGTRSLTTGQSRDEDASPANACTMAEVEDDAGLPEGACCEDAEACYDGPDRTRGVGRCKAGSRACEDGKLGSCEGSVLPRAETCDNQGADDNCDGKLDNVPDLGKACMLPASQRTCGQGVQACVSGKKGLQCVLETPPAETCNARDDDCDGKVDELFDLTKDAMHCGACGTACSAAQACCQGACVMRGAGPGGCPECSAAMPCAAGRSCCSGGCVDMQNSNEHCGACGNACGARQACCAGQCVDTRSDERNCGACGTICSTGDSPTCCGGRCTDVSNDRSNCGECGNSCGNVCTCEPNNGEPVCSGLLGTFCP